MVDENTYQAATWQIKFELNIVDQTGTYKLRLALATANVAEIQVQNSTIHIYFHMIELLTILTNSSFCNCIFDPGPG